MGRHVIDAVLRMNASAFGEKDWFSDAGNLVSYLSASSVKLLTTRLDREVVGYYLIREHETHIEGVRLAVSRLARGRRFGERLVKRALRFAKLRGKPFKTYTAHENVASINLHIKCGARAVRTDEEFIYFARE